MTSPSRDVPGERPTDREHGEIVEPPNGTVDEWFGQQVSCDEEIVDVSLTRPVAMVRKPNAGSRAQPRGPAGRPA
jgi:hypothetical protein